MGTTEIKIERNPIKQILKDKFALTFKLPPSCARRELPES